MFTKICKLTIRTTVDGQESKVVRMGKLTVEEEKILLFYREENAQVQLLLCGDKATVERKGDYELYLPLEKGDSVGRLGLGGSTGELPLATHCVDYAYKGGKLTLSLVYDLGFGKEKQRMQLQITAITKEGR